MDQPKPIGCIALRCCVAMLAAAACIADGTMAKADTVEFRSGESTVLLTIRPETPTRLDVIRFSIPLDGVTYGNDCDAASVLGGGLTILRDDQDQTIELGHDGNVPELCPLIYSPVNGAQGELGPLTPGEWILSDLYANSLQFTVAALCDFDADGLCNAGDIDLMYSVGDIRTGVSVPQADPIFDLDADGAITLLDRDAWLVDAAIQNGFSSSYQLADSNLDGTVDVEDLNTLGLNWQQQGKVWSTGDFDGDGNVGPSDLNLLGRNWRQSIPVMAALSVPEPSGIRLLIIAACLSVGTRSKCTSGDKNRFAG